MENSQQQTILRDRNRFLYPLEWKSFIKSIDKPKYENKMMYELQFNTGARFDEVLHLRPCDFDFDRNNVRLWKTKTKAKKGEKVGKPRTISLSSDFSSRMKRFCGKLGREDYLFKVSQVGYNKLLKTKLKALGIADYSNCSSHNIRKTHGMYLKALGIDIAEICTRLGHDYNTYIKHYGSADIFSEKDMRDIRELVGDLYIRQRRF
jgi:integrase